MDDQQQRDAAAARPGYATYPAYRPPGEPARDDLADLAHAVGVDRVLPEWERELLPDELQLPELRAALAAACAETAKVRGDLEEALRNLHQVGGDHGRAAAAELDLVEIELRAAAADAGPWHVELGRAGGSDGYPQWIKSRAKVEIDGRGWPQRVTTDQAVIVAETCTGPEYPPANAIFIAHARDDVPRLIAEVRSLRTRLRGARAWRVSWPWLVTFGVVGFSVALFAAWLIVLGELFRV